MRLYPAYADFFFDQAGTHTFTVPRGAKRMDVTCIGGGGGGGAGGVTYGTIENAYPAGGGGGGSGEIAHARSVPATPGEAHVIIVGAGGAAGKDGGASSLGQLLSAAGGRHGEPGDHEPLAQNVTANGGTGGIGGVGGTGGGAGRGAFSQDVGTDGGYGLSTQTWNTWDPAQWYAFGDAQSLRRLGTGGAGGWGYDRGSFGHQTAQGPSAQTLPGALYGSGGRGGDQARTGVTMTPLAGTGGLVAIRVWYKAG